jgi:hypothetical protein
MAENRVLCLGSVRWVRGLWVKALNWAYFMLSNGAKCQMWRFMHQFKSKIKEDSDGCTETGR